MPACKPRLELHAIEQPRLTLCLVAFQDFGIQDGVPGTAYWRGMKARKELLR